MKWGRGLNGEEEIKRKDNGGFFYLFDFVILWSWDDIVGSLNLRLSSSPAFHSVFHTNRQFAALWREQGCIPPLPPILLLSLRTCAMKGTDYWMALKLLFCLPRSLSQSTSLSFQLLYFSLSLSLSNTHTLSHLFI